MSDNQEKQDDSSIGNVIRSFSHVLHLPKFTTSKEDVRDIVSLKDGKFVLDQERLVQVLENGTSIEKTQVIQLLNDKMVNIPTLKRLAIWKIVKEHVELNKNTKLRREAFLLFEQCLKLNKLTQETKMECYKDITNNIRFEEPGDEDLDVLLFCLYELTERGQCCKPFMEIENYSFDKLMLDAFEQAKAHKEEDVESLIISFMSDCLKSDSKIFGLEYLKLFLKDIIDICCTSNNLSLLNSFVIFTSSFIIANKIPDDFFYSIISIIGYTNAVDEVLLSEEGDKIIETLLTNEETARPTLITIFDVITGRNNDKYKHRSGIKPVVGGIKYLNFTVKFLGKSKLVTNFFEHYLNYSFNSLLVAAVLDNDSASIEILKFIIEVLEDPYTVKGYYKYFISNSLFWELIYQLNWSEKKGKISIDYKEVQIELFNILQNLSLNKLYIGKVVKYFASNYTILTSYNIKFALKYYSDSSLCICGALQWQNNCKKLLERYYSTSPLDVFDVLKEAFLNCVPLRIDEPSTTFYIDILCYVCILDLPFQLSEDMIDPIADVLLNVKEDQFEIIIKTYISRMKDIKEKNRVFLLKLLIAFLLKSASQPEMSNQSNFVLEIIIQISKFSFQNGMDDLFLLTIKLLLTVRCTQIGDEKYLHFLRFIDSDESDVASDNESIIEIEQEDFKFKLLIEKYFINGKTGLFKLSQVNITQLLSIYYQVLSDATVWDFYYLILRHLKSQLLNSDLFLPDCVNGIRNLIDLLTEQLHIIYSFKFDIPEKMTKEDIRISIIDILFAIFPYKNILSENDHKNVTRSFVLDFHFCEDTRRSIMNFMNCCLYELTETMKQFMLPILKVLESDLLNVETFPSTLEFFLNLSEIPSFKFNTDEFTKIFHILINILNRSYQISETNVSHYVKILTYHLIIQYYGKLNEQQKLQLKIFIKNSLVGLTISASTEAVSQPKIEINLVHVVSKLDPDNVTPNSLDSFNPFDSFLTLLNPFFTNTKERITYSEILLDINIHLSSTTPSQLKKIAPNENENIVIYWNDSGTDVEYSDYSVIINCVHDNLDFYSVSTEGLEVIGLDSVIVSKDNIKYFAKNLGFVCSLVLLTKKTERLDLLVKNKILSMIS